MSALQARSKSKLLGAASDTRATFQWVWVHRSCGRCQVGGNSNVGDMGARSALEFLHLRRLQESVCAGGPLIVSYI